MFNPKFRLQVGIYIEIYEAAKIEKRDFSYDSRGKDFERNLIFHIFYLTGSLKKNRKKSLVKHALVKFPIIGPRHSI